jgi:hypothetical protein
MNSRPSSWAPSQLYWRTEREPNRRKDLEAGKQELGHRKQRRLKPQYLWDIPESDAVSKSAQSAPDGYFQNTSVPRGHPAVTSKTPVCHIITRLLPSTWPAQPVLTRLLSLKNADVISSRSAVTSKDADDVISRSAVTSKTPMSSSHSAVTSKTPMSSSHSAVTSKTPMSFLVARRL